MSTEGFGKNITSAPITGDRLTLDEFGLFRDEKRRPVTNADRIRAMSDGELADWITNIDPDNPCPPDNSCSCTKSNCMKGWLGWLQSPVEEGDK